MRTVRQDVRSWEPPESIDEWKEVIREKVYALTPEDLNFTNVTKTLAGIMSYYRTMLPLIFFETEKIVVDGDESGNWIEARIVYGNNLKHIYIDETSAWTFKDERLSMRITESEICIRFTTDQEIQGNVWREGMKLINQSVKRLRRFFNHQYSIYEKQNEKLELALVSLVQRRLREFEERAKREKKARRIAREEKKRERLQPKKRKKKPERSGSLFK